MACIKHIRIKIFLLVFYFMGILSLIMPMQESKAQSADNSSIIKEVPLPFESEEELDNDNELNDEEDFIARRIINNVSIFGNKHIETKAILNKINYKPGQLYDPYRSRDVIRALFNMGAFSDAQIYTKELDPDLIDIYIIVQEKKLLKDMTFQGNKNLPEKDIIKKGFNPKDIQFIDSTDMKRYAKILKKLYSEKDFHNVSIKPSLTEESDNKYKATFIIDENKKSIVQQVRFIGNKAFSDKILRSKLYTREDWVLGFMDRAGSFQPDAVEADRHVLEDFYQSNGFLNAKVPKVDIEHIPGTHFVNVTFHIEEGDVYTISQVHAPGNDEISESILLAQIPVKPKQFYSKDFIRNSIELLRSFWGQYGYFDVDIEPLIEPNDDEKTVKITFLSELGKKVYVNRVNVFKNEKTRDKVIRREFTFAPGDLLTTNKMEETKTRVEGLGFFDQKEGCSWKIKRQNAETVDVDLYVREVKTGRFDLQLGWGGVLKDTKSVADGIRIGGSLSDTNLFGRGIAFNLSGQFAKNEKELLFNLTEPWLFDRPIYAALDTAFKRTTYDDFKFTVKDIKEDLRSGSFSLGWTALTLNCTKFIGIAGFEGIHYSTPPQVNPNQIFDPKIRQEFQLILDKRFPNGNVPWLGFQAGQDFRNHPLFPSRGYQWLFQSKLGIPFNRFNQINRFNQFGFWKFDLDASYYTPLIGEYDLVFCLHGHFGAITAFKGKSIPFRELYNVGGPSNVRGFLFGEIGPTFALTKNDPGDPLGSTKAFWLNAELTFPITSDFSIRGAVFYDGGAGWATPNADLISPKRLRHNGFDYRHAVGLGVRILRPTPIRIDWGFKLDKRKGEKESEVHFTMSHTF